MSTVIRATNRAELLGLVPTLAGFTPRNSLVLLPFHDGRCYGAMRLDLPAGRITAAAYARAALGALAQVQDVDAAAVVLYASGAKAKVGSPLAHRAVVDAVLKAAARRRLRVVDALFVGEHGWGDYREPAEPLHPLEDIPAPPVIPGIGDLGKDQTSGSALPEITSDRRAQVSAALGDLTLLIARHEHGGAVPTAAENPLSRRVVDTMMDDLPRFVEQLLDRPEIPDPHACAAVLWLMSRPLLRDAVLVQWATSEAFGRVTLDAQLAFSESGERIPESVGSVFLGHGTRPDADRLGCALQVARQAAASAPPQARAGALTAAGWLSWALGRSSHAAAYVEQALKAEPQHGLASLLATMLNAGLLPEWALRRP